MKIEFEGKSCAERIFVYPELTRVPPKEFAAISSPILVQRKLKRIESELKKMTPECQTDRKRALSMPLC